MDDERFLNSYHNASTPPDPDVPAELAGFMLAADPVLGSGCRAGQGARTRSPGGRDTADRRGVGPRPQVLLAVREVRGVGRLPSAGTRGWHPRLRAHGEPPDPP